jgi:cell fate regulator YaaT (PSP1 superfamily)
VWFHKLRTETVASADEFDDGDWVIVVADRGLDIGQVITRTRKPGPREMRDVRGVLRKATQHEIDSVASKETRENQAMHFCQAQASELGLPMQIIGAEFQFDGKKLTVYYTAIRYIDFRELVRVMFRSYGTRIWMVWCDGGAPVRDVLTRKAGGIAEYQAGGP